MCSNPPIAAFRFATHRAAVMAACGLDTLVRRTPARVQTWLTAAHP